MAQQYNVQPGDTVDSIAQSVYGDASMAQTLKDNGITSLLPGQKLELPDAPAVPAQNPAPVSPVGAAIAGALPSTTPTQPSVPGQPGAISGQTPLEQMPLAPTPPQAPNYPRPEMQGGDQTFTLFNNLVSGNLQMPDVTKLQTPAEYEAYRMYQNYNQYKSADPKTLYDAIQQGKITPDPTNVLWRAIGGANGEPTESMVKAYGWWKLAQDRDASQRRTGDPFLKGEFPKPKDINDANALLNQDQNNAITGDGDTSGAMVSEGTTDVDLTDQQYQEFYDELVTMVNIKGPAAPEYEKSLMSLRGQYDITQLEGDLDLLQKEYRDMEAITRQRLQYQTDQPVAMNVIAGRMSEVERQQKERLDYLGREIKYRSDMINTANQAIEGIMKAKQMDYGVAREQWQDSVKAAQGFIDGFATMRKNELDAQESLRQDAQANLTAFYNLITEGTMDTTTMTPSQMAQIGRMEAMAGMPMGTFLDLHSKYPDKEVKGNTVRYDALGNKYVDFVMQDRITGKPSITTIAAGYDAEKALGLAQDQLGIVETGLDIKKKQDDLLFGAPLAREKARLDIVETGLDIKKKQDDLLFGAPLAREKARLDIDSARSTLTGKDLENQQKYQEVYGRKVGAGDYFKNFGAITGPNGSPLWKYGLDIDLKKGDPVPSPVNGTIIATKENGGFGKQVQIRGEDGNTFWLSHLDGYIGSVGEKVTAGQMVGIGGNTGNTIPGKGGDGSHLDLTGVRPDGSYMSAQEVQKYIEKNYSSQYTGQPAQSSTGSRSTGAASMYDAKGAIIPAKATSYMSNIINTAIGKDGYVSEEDYGALKRQWIQLGLKSADFDASFKTYVNPSFYSSYDLDGPSKQESYFMNRSEKDQRVAEERANRGIGEKTVDFLSEITNQASQYGGN